MILDLPTDFIQTIQNAFERKGQRWLDTLPGLLAEALLHGDFHHFNVLKSARGWLVIDPKSVIGPHGYEVGPFLINPAPKFLTAAIRKHEQRSGLLSCLSGWVWSASASVLGAFAILSFLPGGVWKITIRVGEITASVVRIYSRWCKNKKTASCTTRLSFKK